MNLIVYNNFNNLLIRFILISLIKFYYYYYYYYYYFYFFTYVNKKLFGGIEKNPSWEAAKTFKDKVISENGNNVRLEVEYFDVDYDSVEG